VLFGGAIATGRAESVTTHGVSMSPVYHQGDLVIVTKSGSYEVGQVVAYRVDTEHLVVLHRIVGGNARGFVMKGDNNKSTDPIRPTHNQIIGRARMQIPRGGAWLSHLTSPLALGLVAFGLIAGGGTAIHTRRRRRRTSSPSQQASSTSRVGLAIPYLPAHLRNAAAVIAAVAAAGLAVGAIAWTAAPHSVRHWNTLDTQRLVFSYSADVGQTAAYDGPAVHSPDPVFRRLTHTVDVHLAYHGRPATMTVAAELSTATGWHSRVALKSATTLNAQRHGTTVRLDLDALDARAQAAAAVTGLPASSLAVSVVARIESPGSTPFRPAMQLNLSPLQVSLGGNPSGLTVRKNTSVAHTASTPHVLDLLGWHTTVNQARLLSAMLLLAALLAGTALLSFARRAAPDGEGAAIRQRYAHLIATVRPVIIPPDRPVIEVGEFATLAKMAERCGLLVLHWSRNGVDTFVLLDDGTTYRYGAAPQRPVELAAPVELRSA
jgi:signal peptidase I